MEFGFYSAGTFTNVSVYGNKATNWVNWDEPGNGYHHNFVHAFTNLPGANLTGSLQIYNNQVDSETLVLMLLPVGFPGE